MRGHTIDKSSTFRKELLNPNDRLHTANVMGWLLGWKCKKRWITESEDRKATVLLKQNPVNKIMHTNPQALIRIHNESLNLV